MVKNAPYNAGDVERLWAANYRAHAPCSLSATAREKPVRRDEESACCNEKILHAATKTRGSHK